MSPNRRDFLWTMGATAGALALVPVGEMLWPPAVPEGPGWTPGIEEWKASACLLCPARCGIRGRVVDGNLVRITGNPVHPMSRGGVCARGVAGVQMLYHPDRVTSPLVRTGDGDTSGWEQASLEEVLGQITQHLTRLRQAARPQALAGLLGYLPGTMDDVWSRFFEAFGSPNLVHAARSDGTAAVMEAMHGIRRRPGYDLENADTVFSFGAPLFEAWWSPLQAYAAFARAADGEHARHFIHVDHRFSHTAAHADEWVGVKPGTHGVLALGMAYVILRDRLHDEAFLADHVSGFEDFTDARGRTREGFRTAVMRRYRTEEVSAVTGVSVERITALARTFAAGARSVAVCGQDVMLSRTGLVSGMAVHSLNLLVGSVGRAGGVVFGDGPPLAPLSPVAADPVSRVGLSGPPLIGAAPAFGPGDEAARFAASVVAAEEGALPEVLFVYGADPVGWSRRRDLWEQALDRIPLVVSFSPFLDETTRYADIVIPDLLPWERWQDAPTPASYPYPVWAVSRPMVSPAPGATHAGEILFSLARSLGDPVAESLPYETFEDLLKSRARGLYDAHRGRTLATDFEMEDERERERRGWWLPGESDFESFWSELVERGGWADLFYDDTESSRFAHTRDKRIALMPPAVLEALSNEGSEPQPYAGPVAGGDEEDPAYPIRLLPYQVSTLTSDLLGLEPWLAEAPAVLPDVHWVPWVSVAPGTAREFGLEQDRMVWVVSPRGRYRARLRVSPGIAARTAAAPIGIRHPDGEAANPLALLEDASDPHTGMPAWFTTYVRLEGA